MLRQYILLNSEIMAFDDCFAWNFIFLRKMFYLSIIQALLNTIKDGKTGRVWRRAVILGNILKKVKEWSQRSGLKYIHKMLVKLLTKVTVRGYKHLSRKMSQDYYDKIDSSYRWSNLKPVIWCILSHATLLLLCRRWG